MTVPDQDESDKSAADAPLAWGSADEMNALEVLMWRAETDRSLSSTVVGLEQLDVVPDWDRFVAAHEWAVKMVPRFRQRVVEAPLGIGNPRWAVDPEFDLRYHLRRMALPGAGGWAELLEAAAAIAMAPFDRSRPPWEVVLFEGLPDGRGAYLLKLHHSATDGLGIMQLLSQLHSRRRETTMDKPNPPLPEAVSSNPVETLVGQLVSDVSAVPGVLGGIGSGLLGAVRDPKGALRYGQSLRRVLTPPEASGSPLLAKRGLTWRFAALDIPFADLKAAGKAASGSLNDAYLAALLGGYRRYHEAMGAQVPEAIPIAIPISLRKPNDPPGGNRISSARISAPLGTTDPRARIEEVRALILAAKGERANDVIGMFSPALARLPGQVIAQVAGPLTKGNDLQASNVPGIGEDFYLAGAKVERLYPYAPLPGCAAMITFVSHGPIGCVGVNFDLASFTEPDRFVQSLREGFLEVLALGSGSADVVIRA
ncbi:MAG TPA: wax ester/triacylglycerol synthase domain-containing protein [Pseudonocardia sp.]|jgi:WS/DGAT/MGAT family acyltransferase